MNNNWYKNYIEGANISDIRYLKLSDDELKEFYNKNDYIPREGYFTLADDGTFGWVAPRGMHYLSFDNMYGMKYIVGVADNSASKETIISALAYIDDYKLFNEQSKFITYFSTVETNVYFRGMGLFKDLIRNPYEFINPNQNILISSESVMGKRCNVYRNIIDIYRNMGFMMDIRSDSDDFDENEYYEFLKKNNYIKIRKK